MATEKELKLLLSPDHYAALLKANADKAVPKHQENYYFDTEAFDVSQKRCTLRVRKENDSWIACFKFRNQSAVPSRIVESGEIELELPAVQAEACLRNPQALIDVLPKEVRDILLEKEISIADLRMIGGMTNVRQSFLYRGQYHADLDHTRYPDGSSRYELEVEQLESEAECDAVLACLDEDGIRYSLIEKGKYRQFVETITEMKQTQA